MQNNDKTYSVLDRLPNNGQKVLCYGYKTYCCKEDMEPEADWHEAIFKFHISSYRLKKDFPDDPEESVLSHYEIKESWDVDEEEYGGGEHVIGVSKWKRLLKTS